MTAEDDTVELINLMKNCFYYPRKETKVKMDHLTFDACWDDEIYE